MRSGNRVRDSALHLSGRRLHGGWHTLAHSSPVCNQSLRIGPRANRQSSSFLPSGPQLQEREGQMGEAWIQSQTRWERALTCSWPWTSAASFLSSYHHLVRGSLPLEHSVLFHSPYQSPRGSRCSIWTSPGEAWPHCSPAWWPGTWWPVTACPASTSTTPRLWPPAGPCPILWQHSPPL